MQEIYQISRQPVADRGVRSGQFFEDPPAVDDTIRKRIAEARAMARTGNVRTARAVCADIVLEHQFRLHDDRNLLREAVGALVCARAFQMLSRLLLAVDGRRVRVSVADATADAAGPPAFIRRTEQGGIESYSVEEKLFQDPSCDAIIDRWSERLIDTGQNPAKAAAV